ncbi:hypothetical protein QBB33_27690 [Streptomyces scabiei]|uniref:hypothetical protein n=1 Tax=Streptomyces scabiei TaxID=1930 RepID=UPI001B30667C|nr:MULTISPECIES: hypothetical protein [Streptomyces]MBP5872684.1 hypothetical protein [Streptomyces sp. LBUM 1485]MBP5911932.1 hypothetical protein [Streptomyces sp. LBUM 1486]MDX3029516.1 hypothetical protein [Streptomyces scabiei]MDX3208105.1 hypothetical protein [Streptomyces scabiei]QTU58566.1 hypothetical protein F3K21_42365 [Streptomyces sp. LBUM 1480]
MNDDELLAQLKAMDPAVISKAPRPDVPRLVEATMNTATPTTVTTGKPAPRRLLVPALAFAALLLVGGGIAWGPGQGADVDTLDKPDLAMTLRLQPGGAAVKCAAPTSESLRQNELAFEGTVTAKKGDAVSLEVDHWYRAPADRSTTTVRLTQDESNSEAVSFQVGEHYLVTAENGTIPICGGTTVATDETREWFRHAF